VIETVLCQASSSLCRGRRGGLVLVGGRTDEVIEYWITVTTQSTTMSAALVTIKLAHVRVINAAMVTVVTVTRYQLLSRRDATAAAGVVRWFHVTAVAVISVHRTALVFLRCTQRRQRQSMGRYVPQSINQSISQSIDHAIKIGLCNSSLQTGQKTIFI